MAQFARPSQDISINSWRTQAGASTNLWPSINEVTSDDVATFVVSSISDDTVYEARLSGVTPALIDRLHILRYRGRKNSAAGNTRGVRVDILQGASAIATNSHPDLTALWADGAILLTKEQGALITDYDDLRVRFTPLGSTTGTTARRSIQMSWIQLRVPDWQPTYDNDWGADEDTTTPGLVKLILNGEQVEAPDAEQARVLLAERFRDKIYPLGYDDPEYQKWGFVRFPMAYYSRKKTSYTTLRAQIEAGGAMWNATQTKAEALAVVDAKIGRFQQITADAAAQEII